MLHVPDTNTWASAGRTRGVKSLDSKRMVTRWRRAYWLAKRLDFDRWSWVVDLLERRTLRIFETACQSGFSGPIVVERVNGTGGPLTAEEIDELILQARMNLTGLLKESGLT